MKLQRIALFLICIAVLVFPVSAMTSSFTQSPNPSTVGQSVTFNGSGSDSPTTWNWTFGDIGGSNTSTAQNTTHAYTVFGNYTVTLNVTNASGAYNITSQFHNVTNVTGIVPRDIWMQGQYIHTFYVTDSSTGLPITDVTVSDNSGQTFNATNGTGSLTEGFGVFVAYFTATGYIGRSQSYFSDSDANHTIQLTRTTTSSQTQFVSTKTVRFKCQDYNGDPIVGMYVSARATETTLGSLDWVATLFGINIGTTPILNTTMYGTTGDDGSVIFVMIPTSKYAMQYYDVGYNINETRYYYPSEDTYIETFWTELPTYSLTKIDYHFYSVKNETNGTMTVGASYNDTYSSTDNLTFTVMDENKSVIYQSFSPTPSTCNVSYTFNYTPNKYYYWQIHCNSTVFQNPINATHYVHVDANQWRINPMDAPNNDSMAEYIYNGVAVIMINVFAYISGRLRIRFNLVYVAAWGLFFWGIGWLNTTYTLVSVAMAYSIIMYIRYAEEESSS